MKPLLLVAGTVITVTCWVPISYYFLSLFLPDVGAALLTALTAIVIVMTGCITAMEAAE